MSAMHLKKARDRYASSDPVFVKNSLMLSVVMPCSSRLNAADVDRKSASAQLVEDHVLHQVIIFYLPESEHGVAHADVAEIIFLRRADVLLPLDVEARRAERLV